MDFVFKPPTMKTGDLRQLKTGICDYIWLETIAISGEPLRERCSKKLL